MGNSKRDVEEDKSPLRTHFEQMQQKIKEQDSQLSALHEENERLEEALNLALSWLEGIRDDDRNGVSEICYDEFSYKRREQEFKTAARKAIEEVATLSELEGERGQDENKNISN